MSSLNVKARMIEILQLVKINLTVITRTARNPTERNTFSFSYNIISLLTGKKFEKPNSEVN